MEENTMTINYSVTGAARKALVAAISRELNQPSQYLGVPSFGYQVGDYHIDKNGTVTGADNRELVANLQELHGFVPQSVTYDEPEQTETDSAEQIETDDIPEPPLSDSEPDPELWQDPGKEPQGKDEDAIPQLQP